MKKKGRKDDLMTFGGHLEVLRKMIFRILVITCAVAIVVFSFKDTTWSILLAPSEYNFTTYSWIEQIAHALGMEDFHFPEFHLKLIATDLSSQFMTHLTTSVYLGLLMTAPYILYELFHFISPALMGNERKYSIKTIIAVYFLFMAGVLVSYYLLFPVSFRFLGTYSVSERVESTITLDSYVTTFLTLTLMMGVMFQLPAVSFVLAKMGMVNATMLAHYRKHALVLILVVAAVITPGQDVLSLVLVSLPLYLLYEAGIIVARRATGRRGI